MADLDWHSFYEIGVDFIDEEHKEILSVMRNMRDALIGCELEKAYALSNDIISVSNDHFKHEENFLAEVGYPGLLEHSDYHGELLVQAANIKDLCHGIEAEHDLMTCFEEMRNFMIHDILYGDVMFKSYLEHKGYIERKL